MESSTKTQGERRASEQRGQETSLEGIIDKVLKEKADTTQTPPHRNTAQEEWKAQIAIARGKVDEVLMAFTPKFRQEVLAVALAETEATTNTIDDLNAMEPEIRAAIGKLDVRTKAIFAMISRLGTIEGQVSSCEFTNQLWNELMNDDEAIDACRQELVNEPVGKVLLRAYRLVQKLEADEEDEVGVLDEPMVNEPEGTGEDRGGVEEEEIDATEHPESKHAGQTGLAVDKAYQHLRPVIQWLLNRSPEAKAAAIVLDILEDGDVSRSLKRRGLYDGDLDRDLYTWRNNVLAGLHTEDLNPEASAMTAYVSGLKDGSY